MAGLSAGCLEGQEGAMSMTPPKRLIATTIVIAPSQLPLTFKDEIGHTSPWLRKRLGWAYY